MAPGPCGFLGPVAESGVDERLRELLGVVDRSPKRVGYGVCERARRCAVLWGVTS